ncbi:MAG: tetratricopeptide repeat protein, partial [Bacteroidota bacterium]
VAECYEELNNTERARFYYAKVTNYCPGLPEAYFGMGSTLEAEDRYYEAIHQYQKAVEGNSDMVDAWFGLAECEYLVGNIVSAYEALERALEIDDSDVETMRHWATMLADDNRTDKALEMLARGLQAQPKAVELAYLYAAIAFRVGRLNEAFVILENALMADFEKHQMLYDYCPEIANIRTIQELIAQYRPHA